MGLAAFIVPFMFFFSALNLLHPGEVSDSTGLGIGVPVYLGQCLHFGKITVWSRLGPRGFTGLFRLPRIRAIGRESSLFQSLIVI